MCRSSCSPKATLLLGGKSLHLIEIQYHLNESVLKLREVLTMFVEYVH